jgi:hypothetical protein
LKASQHDLKAMKKKYKNFRDRHPDNVLSVAWKKAQDQTFQKTSPHHSSVIA